MVHEKTPCSAHVSKFSNISHAAKLLSYSDLLKWFQHLFGPLIATTKCCGKTTERRERSDVHQFKPQMRTMRGRPKQNQHTEG